jgi:superfamily II DNA or RNA helicase
MLTPYEHQQECLDILHQQREEGGKRALVVMATGLGKTLTVAWDVQRWIQEHPQSKVLFLCHQNRILGKARGDFQEIIGGDPTLYGFYHGDQKDRNAKYLFGSFQTFAERYSEFGKNEFDYVVVDEGHHSHAVTYGSVIKHFYPKFLLGMTATPDRMDLQDIREFYGEEVFSLPLEEALARRLLTTVDYRLIADDLVTVGEIENPYRLTIEELNRRVFVPPRDEEILRIVNERIADAGIANPKILTFCSGIPHAERILDLMPNARPVHSEIPDKLQDDHIAAFRRGEVSNLITVNQFNEGIDIPEVNVLLFLRTTQSPNIFYQQLGRGLRKIEGKEKVLVLDFAGNCERIEMVNALSKRVTQEIERRKSQAERETQAKATKVFDFGKFEFTQQVVQILDVIGKIEEGYTKEALIEQLIAEAQRIGRTPNSLDIDRASKEGRMASTRAFYCKFRSLQEAQRAAGLPPTVLPQLIEKSKEEAKAILIKQLQDLAEEKGRTLNRDDINEASKAGKIYSSKTFEKYFKNLPQAYLAAGLLPTSLPRLDGKPEEEIKAILIKQLQKLAEEKGRTPNCDDINEASKAEKIYSSAMFAKHFGGIPKARIAAGLPSILLPRLSSRPDEEAKAILIKQLQDLAKEKGRTLNRDDINESSRAGVMYSPSIFTKYFKNLPQAYLAAGLLPTSLPRLDGKPEEEIKAILIKQLQKLAEEKGRTPTQRDIDEASKVGRTYSANTFKRYFENLAEVQIAAGIKTTCLPQLSSMTDEEAKAILIKQLQDLAKEKGRTPNYNDINEVSRVGKIYSLRFFYKYFDNLPQAYLAASLEPNKRGGNTKNKLGKTTTKPSKTIEQASRIIRAEAPQEDHPHNR